MWISNLLRQETAEKSAGREQDAEFYDRRFAAKSRWRDHYTQSRYYPLWTVVADRLKAAGAQSILDVGCGPGQVACLLRDQGIKQYYGVDFSRLRVEHAKKICPQFKFSVSDIFESDCLTAHEYDAVILLEFLEHVDRDLEALSKIRPGVRVIGTVPNFPDDGHVRHFETIDGVKARYGKALKNLRVDAILGNERGKTFFLLDGVAA